MENKTDPFIFRATNTADMPISAQDGPLHGLTLAVKDLFHINGLTTGAGNPDWLKTHPPATATSSVVTRLLTAGTQFLGKTLTDELAYSLNGQNFHYGTPLNYKAIERLPGGSSSGSAAAVASGEADIGLGTDTGGSVRVPASYNGLYGLRPTHGVVATDNMVALAPGFDTVGWLTRDLKTMNKVARVLLPEGTVSSPAKIHFSTELNHLVYHGKTIDNLVENHTDMNFTPCAFSTSLLAKASDAFRVLQGREIWQQHGEWITKHNPNFAPDIKQRLNWCAGLTEEQQYIAQGYQQEVNQTMAAYLEDNHFLLVPTTPGPAPLLKTSAEDLVQYRNHLLGLTALAGLGGLPQLHIPLDTGTEAPLGFSLIGPGGTDLALIEHAFKLTGETP